MATSSFSDLFNVRKQLVFYGAYHTNIVNVRLHQVGVPLIVWSTQIMLASLKTPPPFLPAYRHDFNSLLSFETNWAFVMAAGYYAYYLAMLPSAAITYLPHALITLLSATAVGREGGSAIQAAFAVWVGCWIMQFAGHGVFERRAPALLDNLLGAVVLAPFFIHLELLFEFGWFPQLHKDVQNGIGVEVAKFRRANAEQQRAKEQKHE